VVAAANPGYRTVLTDEAASFLVPPGDAAALAAALERLAKDRSLRERLGAWGRATAPAYDCRALAPRLVEIFRDAIIAHRLDTRLKARSVT
jgi:glycosyltransferase involved in cell wall biosynthesis